MSDLTQEEIQRRRKELDEENDRRLGSCFWRDFFGGFNRKTLEGVLGVNQDDVAVEPTSATEVQAAPK